MERTGSKFLVTSFAHVSCLVGEGYDAWPLEKSSLTFNHPNLNLVGCPLLSLSHTHTHTHTHTLFAAFSFKLLAGIFINVLRAHFLQEILVPKIIKLCFVFEVLAPKILYEKCAGITLMKLTPGWHLHMKGYVREWQSLSLR